MFLQMSACVYPDICFAAFQEIEKVNVIWIMPGGKDHIILVSLSMKKVKKNYVFDVKTTTLTTLQAKTERQFFIL